MRFEVETESAAVSMAMDTAALTELEKLDVTLAEEEQARRDSQSIEILHRVLRRLHDGDPGVEDITAADIVSRRGVDPKYLKLMYRWLLQLAESGRMTRFGERFFFNTPFVETTGATGDFPFDEVVNTLAAKVLPGQTALHDFVHCRDRPHWFDRLGAEAGPPPPVAASQHRIVAAIIRQICTFQRPGLRRLLHMSGGNQNLAGILLSLLDPECWHYEIVDIGSDLRSTTGIAVGSYPNLHSREYRFDGPPAEAGLEAGSFEVIVADHALHRTRDLSRTLPWLYELVMPGGWIVLEELTVNRAHHLILPSMLPDYVNFEDERQKDLLAFLSAEQWHAKLEQAGFEFTRSVPDADRIGRIGGAVLVARKNGSCREPREPGSSRGNRQIAGAEARPRPLKPDLVSAEGHEAAIEVLRRVREGELSRETAERLLDDLKAKGGSGSGGTVPGSYSRRLTAPVRERPDATSRILIFMPFGFGNNGISLWKTRLPPDIEAWVLGADRIATWSRLIHQLTREAARLCNRPFVVFGHSMGAIVAYEVTLRLEARGLNPAAFVASASTTPEVFAKMRHAAPFNSLKPHGDMQLCRTLLEQSHLILPRSAGFRLLDDEGLSNDIRLLLDYSNHVSNERLNCPVISWAANNDVIMRDTNLSAQWEEYAANRFEMEEVNGSHMYFVSPSPTVFERLHRFLTENEAPVTPPTSTYELESMRQGSADMHIYPFGVAACGILIYTDGGEMAVHLWNPERENDSPETDEKTSIELMMTYTFYSGTFQFRKSCLFHTIRTSSFPGELDTTVQRYCEMEEGRMTLRTAPAIRDDQGCQIGSAAFGMLTWKPVQAPKCRHGLVGTWNPVDWTTGGRRPFGRNFRGQLIFTPDGYISCMASKAEPGRPKFQNPVLASADEIAEFFVSVTSFIGRIDRENSDEFDVTLLQQLRPRHSPLRIAYRLDDGGTLLLTWEVPTGDGDSERVSCSWRRRDTGFRECKSAGVPH